jgi:hypothetical protein
LVGEIALQTLRRAALTFALSQKAARTAGALSTWVPPAASLIMSETSSFQCPQCAALYRVVRVEVEAAAGGEREITCPACHAPLQARDGRFALKYFLTGFPKRSRPHAAHASSPA